jgi:hypothetical protein
MPVEGKNLSSRRTQEVVRDLEIGEARAEAQTVRLALLYALLDASNKIGVLHLQAARAVWRYAEASAVRVFGDSLGDPVADEILHALKQAGTAGMTRTQISSLFGRNCSRDRIGTAFALLMSKGRAWSVVSSTGRSGGRPTEVWVAAGGKKG